MKSSVRLWWRAQQEVKVFQKKFLQPAFLSRGERKGPISAAAARSMSAWSSSGSPSARGKFSSKAWFSSCRRSDRSKSAREERLISWNRTRSQPSLWTPMKRAGDLRHDGNLLQNRTDLSVITDLNRLSPSNNQQRQIIMCISITTNIFQWSADIYGWKLWKSRLHSVWHFTFTNLQSSKSATLK